MRLRSMNSRGLATTIRARSFVAADKARSNSLGPPTPNLDPEGLGRGLHLLHRQPGVGGVIPQNGHPRNHREEFSEQLLTRLAISS